MRSIIKVCGKEIRIEGRLIRMAQLEGDGYEYLEDPKAMLEGLRECKTRIDLFSFMQRLPETSPKYAYPMEWDNLAALPVTTFDHWWTQQIGFKARNKAKQGEKKGVVVREAPFDDALVKGYGRFTTRTLSGRGRRTPTSERASRRYIAWKRHFSTVASSLAHISETI